MARLSTRVFPLLLAAALGSPAIAEPDPPAPAAQPSAADAPAAGQPSAPADLGAANALVREGRYEEAARLLGDLRSGRGDDPSLLLMHGEVLLALQRPAEARELLGQAAALAPERARVQFQLGTALAATGERQGALEAFSREIASNDDPQIKILAHLNRSVLLQQDQLWSAAAEELEAVVRLDPDRMQAFGDLATLYLQAGAIDHAERALARGIEAGFSSGQHYYSLGARVYQEADYGRAVTLFSRALELSPGMAQAERSLAAALERLDRRGEAIQHLRRYLELAPDAPDAGEVTRRIQEAEKR